MTRGHPVNSKRVLTEFPTAGRQPACYRRSAVCRPIVDNSTRRDKNLTRMTSTE
jgi:hypothetical protein